MPVVMERPVPAPRISLRYKPPVPKRHIPPEPPRRRAFTDYAMQEDSKPCVVPRRPSCAGSQPRQMSPPPVPQKPLRLSTAPSDRSHSPSAISSSSSSSRCSSSLSSLAPPKPNRCSASPTHDSASPAYSHSSSPAPPSPFPPSRSRSQSERYSVPSDILADEIAARSSLLHPSDHENPDPLSYFEHEDVLPPLPAKRKHSESVSLTSTEQFRTHRGSSSSAPFPRYATPVCCSPKRSSSGNNDISPANPQRSPRRENVIEQPDTTESRPASALDTTAPHTPPSADWISNSVASVNLIDFSDESSTAAVEPQAYGSAGAQLGSKEIRTSPVRRYENISITDEEVKSAEEGNWHTPSHPTPLLPLVEAVPGDATAHSIDELLCDLEIGPNGSIWNPGYIGLEEYRKMVQASEMAAAKNDYMSHSELLNPPSENAHDVSPPYASPDTGNCPDVGPCSSAQGEAICFSGWVHLVFNKKERGRLWAVLRSNQLTFYSTDDQDDCLMLGPYELRNAIYVGRSPYSENEINICLKENALSLHWNHLKMIAEQSSNHWVLLIAKCMTPRHDALAFSMRSADGGGKVWIRQGATCPWSQGWLILDQRKVFYILENCAMLFELDVRKFIAMKNEVAKVDWCASVAGSVRGPFLLAQDGGSLYIQAECDSVTTLWSELILSDMERIGSKLEDHKLTADDVPIIVDKCIKYISTYGLLQPGLYRRNGSSVEVRVLLEELKRDPVNVHITPTNDDMVNVVASVLRAFFRDLESPLIPHYIQERLFSIAEIKDASKLDEYHEVLMSLKRIRLQTVRRMLDHLKDVTEHSYANLATVENIAKVFGPTLFSVEHAKDEGIFDGFGKTVQQVNVLKELIINYAVIFRVSVREMHAKSKIDSVHAKANASKARADGFLVPIHLLEKDSYTFNVQSSLTAEQVCAAACKRPSFHDQQSALFYALFEVIKNGQLERRVGWREKMSVMVTGRWLDWDPTDCYLLFKRDPSPFSFDHLYPFADDVKIAEPGSKSFNTGHLKLETGTTVIHYNKSMKQVNEWHVDDIIWYTEHEATRKPPYPYTLTFLPKKNLKYKSKHIGYCVAFKENNLRAQWLNSVLSSQLDFQATPTPPLLQI